MNRKWLTFGAPLAAGAVLLMVSGFTANAGTSGYDIYKEALKSHAGVKSVTAQVNVTVADNGKETIHADAEFKLDKENEAVSGSLLLEGEGTEARTVNVHHQDGELILGNGTDGTYYSLDPQNGPPQFRHGDSSQGEERQFGPPKEFEHIVDALVGNLKQQIETDEQSDGSTALSLHLSGSKIPAIVSTLGSIAIKHASSADQPGGAPWGHHNGAASGANEKDGSNTESSIALKVLGGEWNPQLPELTDDVRIEAINLDAVVGEDHHLQHQTLNISAAGKDDAGLNHDVSITFDMNFSNYDRTLADRIDLSGKQVEKIELPEHEGWSHR